MTDPAPAFPSFPALSGKKVSAAFDGGRITSDGGVLLLAEAERKLGIAGRLAALIPDRRDPSRVLHPFGRYPKIKTPFLTPFSPIHGAVPVDYLKDK